MTIQELYKLFIAHPLICTDTRKIVDKSIFFALKGENFNGNNYAQSAIEKGCVYAIVDEEKFCKNDKIILVANVLKTLQELAQHHIEQLAIPIIGITGTNGKTTSKELINAVLSSEKNCYASKGNLNNHIGVPLSILGINQKHEIAIIEMGANHIEEISFLCNITKPNFGVITNIGKAHLEGFRSFEGVIKAKSELYNYIQKNNGTIFVNNESELLLELANNINKITYGKSGDYTGAISESTPFISVVFQDEEIKSKLIGDYQFYNIMLAICFGKHFGVSINNIKTAIENYTPTNNRSQIIETNNNTIILDAYNANPSSMTAMLYSFAKQNYQNKLCILGDMLEMGETSLKEHKAIINLAEELKLECIFIGKEFTQVHKQAYNSTDEFSKVLKSNSIKNKTILLKGSRGIALEKLVDLL
ncbi:MAG TPA: UDP-N-acetylmuramoyl-tripeptide--D-alanyl-D-alanine ligase [Flavobacteriales bacterium]|nr:UDP-N-acetylmuramoyl-tripeptide--D-alanyl-D-alanine ligase [Flavobacteriales bacterium]